MSDTPRTDAACLIEYRAWNHPNNGTSRVAVLATLARTLERELAEALDVAERAVKMAQEVQDETALRTLDVAGIPCRFCMGRGSVDGPCLECGRPNAERARAENATRLLALVLPMAKAFASKSDVGSNVDYILEAEEFMVRERCALAICEGACAFPECCTAAHHPK